MANKKSNLLSKGHESPIGTRTTNARCHSFHEHFELKLPPNYSQFGEGNPQICSDPSTNRTRDPKRNLQKARGLRVRSITSSFFSLDSGLNTFLTAPNHLPFFPMVPHLAPRNNHSEEEQAKSPNLYLSDPTLDDDTETTAAQITHRERQTLVEEEIAKPFRGSKETKALSVERSSEEETRRRQRGGGTAELRRGLQRNHVAWKVVGGARRRSRRQTPTNFGWS